MFSTGKHAHHPGTKKQGKRRKHHQRNTASKPRHSKRRRYAVKQHRERARRYSQTRDQELSRQLREILLTDQPKLVAVESLRYANMKASARGTADNPGKNVRAKRKLNESLSEAAIGHVGKLLCEEAAKLGIPTVTVPPQGASQTCPRRGHQHPDNRDSQVVFRCRNCGLYAHADWTVAVIIATAPTCVTANGNPGRRQAWPKHPPGGESSHPALSGNQFWCCQSTACSSPKGNATSRHQRQGPGPQAGEPYPKRHARRPKCWSIQRANLISGYVLILSTRSRGRTWPTT